MSDAIQVEGLVKVFKGEVRALDGLSLVVQPGSVDGLLGPNGAGKTTLIRMLATLLQPDEGSAQDRRPLFRRPARPGPGPGRPPPGRTIAGQVLLALAWAGRHHRDLRPLAVRAYRRTVS